MSELAVQLGELLIAAVDGVMVVVYACFYLVFLC
jgi:hypothetical protein